MIDQKTFEKTINIPLKMAGFLKKGQSWYLNGNDAIVVINHQKSKWDKFIYINIGIWMKAFGEAIYPQFNHCPLYYRVEDLFPEKRELILTGCSLDKASLENLDDLSTFIANELTPFLKECTEESGLRNLMSQGRLDRGFVRLDAKWYLIGE